MNLTSSVTGLTTTCGTCDGSGYGAQGDHEGPFRACPTCDARGWLTDPDRLEAAAATLVPSDTTPSNTAEKWMPYFRDKAEAAVLAYLEPPS